MFSYLLFCNSKLGKQIGGGLLITNHLNQSLQRANKKHKTTIRSYLWHFFFYKCTTLLHLSPTITNCVIMLSQIDIFWIIKIKFFNVEKHDLKSICVKESQNCLQKLSQMFFLLHKNIKKNLLEKNISHWKATHFSNLSFQFLLDKKCFPQFFWFH